MTKIVPNDLLNPTEKAIKNWNCSFIAVEGPNILDKLSLEDLAIPYESQYRSRAILKAGESDQPLIYGFVGKAVTFLMVKVTYDSENDPYYKYEEEKYNITYYFENDPIVRPLGRLLIMTGSAEEKIPQIYLNNPLDYDVVLDVLHATIDTEYSGITSDGFGMINLSDILFSGLTSGDTLQYNGTYWINVTGGTTGTSGTSGINGISGSSGTSGTGFNTISNPINNAFLTSDGTNNSAKSNSNLLFLDGNDLYLWGSGSTLSGTSFLINSYSFWHRVDYDNYIAGSVYFNPEMDTRFSVRSSNKSYLNVSDKKSNVINGLKIESNRNEWNGPLLSIYSGYTSIESITGITIPVIGWENASGYTDGKTIFFTPVYFSQYSTSGFLAVRNSGETYTITGLTETKSINIINPTSSEDIIVFYTSNTIIINKIQAVVKGTTPSVTIQLMYGSDVSLSGTTILTNTAISNTTTGQNINSFNNNSVSDNNWIKLTTSATSGSVTLLHLTIMYTNLY